MRAEATCAVAAGARVLTPLAIAVSRYAIGITTEMVAHKLDTDRDRRSNKTGVHDVYISTEREWISTPNSTDVLIGPLTLPHNVVIIHKHLDYQASLNSDSRDLKLYSNVVEQTGAAAIVSL